MNKNRSRGKARQGAGFSFVILFTLIVCLLLSSCKVDPNTLNRQWEVFTAPHRHFVDMDSYKMHYIDIGQGFPVIMIHGFADSTYCWHANAKPLLDAGFRVIMIDNPGLGRSDIPPDSFKMTLENLSAQTIRLADKLKLEQFSVVGSSMGGGIGLYLMVHNPDRVKKAILLDPACYLTDKPQLLTLFQNKYLQKAAEHVVGPSTIKIALRDCYYDDSKVTGTMVAEYSRPLKKKGYVNLLSRLLTEFPSKAAERTVPLYKKISTPVLIIWGDSDRWLSPSLGRRLNKDIPGSKLITIAESGHLPHQEQYHTVNPLLVGFLLAKK